MRRAPEAFPGAEFSVSGAENRSPPRPEPAAGGGQGQGWLLMFHQLPPKPAYLRVKTWRRMRALGAVAVKNSVYVLPLSEQCREDFAWLLRDITQSGGEGTICEARFVGGLTDDEIHKFFVQAREADYRELDDQARMLSETLAAQGGLVDADKVAGQIVKFRKRLADIAAIDFFGSPLRKTIGDRLDDIESKMRKPAPEEPAAVAPAGSLARRVWVTRRGVGPDRMSSAWLIRRFIDPEATFKFVDGDGYLPEAGELRFDMFDAEFTHEGEDCTCEVLLRRTGLSDDHALADLGQIIHDLDLKDGKFGREEAIGVGLILDGIAASNQNDEQRIARATGIFDDFYALSSKNREKKTNQ
jgi:hypothetical protein